MNLKRFCVYSYWVLRPLILPIAERLRPVLKPKIRSARLPITVEEYVALMVSSFLLSFFLSLLLLHILIPVLEMDPRIALLIPPLASVAGLSFAYFLPSYVASNLKREIDALLPYAVAHMATIAGTGIPPQKIFEMLAEFQEYGAVAKEAAKIVKNTKVFGYDLLTALSIEAKTTPSDKFRDLLWGIIAEIRSGGDLRVFLTEKARSLMEDHRRKEREYIDTLSMLSEIYSTGFVAAPILMVVLVGVMGMLGEFPLPIPIGVLLKLAIYIGIPLASIAFIIMIESSRPEGIM